eukprot:TRINITY_DN12642_c0_g1_i1.p1 TRINITY_DN12642_c0_g1~~TRINITY_DN12642_c0_g1_i1.p1  ORF type:complete len:179 (+),score=18.30 TRINITY_DN12642_c0_g1_i1:267-803(+)
MADTERWTTSNSAYGSFWRAVPLEPKVLEPEKVAADPRNSEESRARLAKLLRRNNVRERPVEMDGNCQFRALADQLYASQDYHEQIRSQVIAQLRTHPDRYASFVPGNFEAYITEMERDGTWGDHVTLQAAADALCVRINVLTDYLTDGFIDVVPRDQKSKKILRVTFWSEVHYNSVE